MQLTFPESILMRKIASAHRADLPVSSLLFWRLQNINHGNHSWVAGYKPSISSITPLYQLLEKTAIKNTLNHLN